MSDNKKCPECGSGNFVMGVSSGYNTGIKKMGSGSAKIGTPITYEVCVDCGRIISMKAVDPKKLKSNVSV